MDSERVLGAVAIGATGLGLLAIAIRQLLLGIGPPVGILIAVVLLLFGAAFTVFAPIAFRSTLDSKYLLRIGGWNTLGVILTTAILWLIAAFQAASGGRVTAPLLSGALVVGVSAFAHVLIGFNDVRRIRAQTVASQRQKAAVVNRFVRHDLKHIAQLLLGYGGQLDGEEDAGNPEGLALGEKIRDFGAQLSDTQEQIKVIDDLLETENPRDPIDVHAIVTDHAPSWQDAYPDATVTVDLPAGLTVEAGNHLETAIVELIENGLEHGGDPTTVIVRGSRTDGMVQVDVLDTGPGFPDHERALINDDLTESQLQHSSGLGLWLAKWIVNHYEGTLSIGTREDESGSVVTVTLPAADQ